MNIQELQKDLSDIMKKHKICISGAVFVNDFDDARYETGCRLNMHGNGVLMDIMIDHKPQNQEAIKKNSNAAPAGGSIVIHDRDISFKNDNVVCPADGKSYANKREWDNALKKHGCVEVGNEYNRETEKPRPYLGYHDCRPNLERATQQVFEKHGLKG